MRELALADFQIGAFTVALEADEVLRGVRVPILSDNARWGYHKICRKPENSRNRSAPSCAIRNPA